MTRLLELIDRYRQGTTPGFYWDIINIHEL
jgi:hypothetical protein